MPSLNDMTHLATLARLDPTPDDLERFSLQCKKILQYMDSLQKVDTESIEPMYTTLEGHNAMRPDITVQPSTQQDILANAPKKNDDYFIVPRIV